MTKLNIIRLLPIFCVLLTESLSATGLLRRNNLFFHLTSLHFAHHWQPSRLLLNNRQILTNTGLHNGHIFPAAEKVRSFSSKFPPAPSNQAAWKLWPKPFLITSFRYGLLPQDFTREQQREILKLIEDLKKVDSFERFTLSLTFFKESKKVWPMGPNGMSDLINDSAFLRDKEENEQTMEQDPLASLAFQIEQVVNNKRYHWQIALKRQKEISAWLVWAWEQGDQEKMLAKVFEENARLIFAKLFTKDLTNEDYERLSYRIFSLTESPSQFVDDALRIVQTNTNTSSRKKLISRLLFTPTYKSEFSRLATNRDFAYLIFKIDHGSISIEDFRTYLKKLGSHPLVGDLFFHAGKKVTVSVNNQYLEGKIAGISDLDPNENHSAPTLTLLHDDGSSSSFALTQVNLISTTGDSIFPIYTQILDGEVKPRVFGAPKRLQRLAQCISMTKMYSDYHAYEIKIGTVFNELFLFTLQSELSAEMQEWLNHYHALTTSVKEKVKGADALQKRFREKLLISLCLEFLSADIGRPHKENIVMNAMAIITELGYKTWSFNPRGLSASALSQKLAENDYGSDLEKIKSFDDEGLIKLVKAVYAENWERKVTELLEEEISSQLSDALHALIREDSLTLATKNR